MRPVLARLAHGVRRAHQDDHGTSLAELMVGMAVMVVFMTIFTGAVIGMAKTTTSVEAVTSSSAQVNTAFLNLDKLVRYAEAITSPAQSSGTGDWYVEIDSVDVDTSKETCTQLRVDINTKALQQRSWEATSNTDYISKSGWTTLASNVINGSAAAGSTDQPFAFPKDQVSAGTSFQRLAIKLTATTSGASSTSTSRGDMTFTALNSNASDPSNNTVCHQATTGDYRP